MLLFKTSGQTLPKVIEHAMHATDGRPKNAYNGELILLNQTIKTIKDGGAKIRWVMDFVECKEDVEDQSEKIWGKKWRYLIVGKNARHIEPFNIEDLNIINKKYYKSIRRFCKVNPEDEAEVMKKLVFL